MKWQRILGVYQNRSGAKSANNPKQTDTVWRTKYKILKNVQASGGQVFPPSGGGGGGGGPTNDPDVNAFLQCSLVSAQLQIDAVYNLVIGLKAANLWNSFDAIYPFVGGASYTHACNLANPAQFKITWVGGVTHNASGITGDGLTGYGDTGFIPSVNASRYGKNSASIGVYCGTAAPAMALNQRASFVGVQDLGNTSSDIGFYNSSPNQTAAGGPNGVLQAIQNTATEKGHSIVSRTNSNNVDLYSPDGTTTSFAYGSVALTSASFFVLAYNLVGVGAAAFLPATLSFAFMGSGFSASDISVIKSLITQFETALGRA